jgi:hypothetical protein
MAGQRVFLWYRLETLAIDRSSESNALSLPCPELAESSKGILRIDSHVQQATILLLSKSDCNREFHTTN